MKIKAELRAMFLLTKECQVLPENYQGLEEWPVPHPFLEVADGAWPS
jgi:hypothetical protein